MFEKYLSLLPYNPGMIHQMGFYGRRMREESAIRRTGMVFIVLAFMVQFFAVLSPPKSTSADAVFNDGGPGCSVVLNAPKSDAFYANTVNGGLPVESADVVVSGPASCQETVSVASWNAPPGSANFQPYDQQTYVTGKTRTFGVGKHTIDIGINAYCDWQTDLVLGSSTSNHGNANYGPNLMGYKQGGGKICPVPAAPAQAPAAPTPTPAPVATTSTPTPAPTPPALCPLDHTMTINDAACKVCPQDSSMLVGDARCQVCPFDSSMLIGNSQCKSCNGSTSSQDALSCVVIHKTAANTTENVIDANNTTAKPGDVVTYTLYAQNTGKATVKQYSFAENMSDVLVYADPIDPHGGILDNENGIVNWSPVDIAPGATLTEQISVRVKSPIPANAASTSAPAQYDLTMSNTYGNTINVHVTPPATQSLVTASASLPNTGPGTDLLFFAAVMMIGSYFYSRSRLLAHESALAVKSASIG